MSIIPQIAEAMQTVLTTTADYAGRLTGFVKQERKLTGSSFVKTVVFGWLGKPDASIGIVEWKMGQKYWHPYSYV